MKKKILIKTLLFVITLNHLSALGQIRTKPLNQEEELGLISWYRNYKEAIQASKTNHKPILILFQEVPGCSTCKKYGNNIIGHPLFAEVIEEYFVPLLIQNNKQGDDKAILNKFNEKAWNNPVIRIIDSNEKNLTKRIAGIYTPKGIHDRLIYFFKEQNIKPPLYFDLLGQELTAEATKQTKTIYYSTYCFWSGEKVFGNINGVLSTEPAHSSKGELVKVNYDQSILSISVLNTIAKENNYRLTERDQSYKKASADDNFYLKKTNYIHLPLTPIQQTKINSAIGEGDDPRKYLSPQQLLWLNSNTLSSTKTFKKAWIDMLSK